MWVQIPFPTSNVLFWPAVSICRKCEEVDRRQIERDVEEKGYGREEKESGEFKRSRAFDADGEWKQLPWKPHPASNESMSKWGEGKKWEQRVNGGMRESEHLTKGICLISVTFVRRRNIKRRINTQAQQTPGVPVSQLTTQRKQPTMQHHLKSTSILKASICSSFISALGPQLSAAQWGPPLSGLLCEAHTPSVY